MVINNNMTKNPYSNLLYIMNKPIIDTKTIKYMNKTLKDLLPIIEKIINLVLATEEYTINNHESLILNTLIKETSTLRITTNIIITTLISTNNHINHITPIFCKPKIKTLLRNIILTLTITIQK
jgi:hypothetical protein